MLEKIKEFIKKNPVSSAVTVLSAGVIIGLSGGNILNGKDGKVLNPDKEVKIENISTKIIQAESGSISALNVLKELPNYRGNDIKDGTSKAAVYCGVQGSDEGKIDFTNSVQEFTSDVNVLENIKIDIPVPNASYDGKYGYGYFIVCGEKKEDGRIKTNFYKRIVYHVLAEEKQINDKSTTFSLKLK